MIVLLVSCGNLKVLIVFCCSCSGCCAVLIEVESRAKAPLYRESGYCLELLGDTILTL
jgi:hypothetical protein